MYHPIVRGGGVQFLVSNFAMPKTVTEKFKTDEEMIIVYEKQEAELHTEYRRVNNAASNVNPADLEKLRSEVKELTINQENFTST